MEHEQDIERLETPWIETKKSLTRLALWLGVVAAVIVLIAFTIARAITAWQCPPRQVASLAEIPTVGGSLVAWQTTGPVYYRYRRFVGEGCSVAVAGATSLEAITAFRAIARNESGWDGVAQENVNEAVKALSSVPGFAFTRSENNVEFVWGGRSEWVYVSLDPRSGWFVAMVCSSTDWPRIDP